MPEEIKTEEQQPKLYAGKFKTVEDLEDGYKNSFKVHQQNSELTKKVEELSKVPDDYMVPEDLSSYQDINYLKGIAASAGLTQSHFDKMAREAFNKSKAQQDSFEQAKKDIGDDKLNVLSDYVKTYYPEKVSDTVLEKIIKDPEARQAALSHRDKMLSSIIPGINKPSYQQYVVTQEDVDKAALTSMQNPGDLKLREKYINVSREYAYQNKKT